MPLFPERLQSSQMIVNNISILCWNVRGLNCPDRRSAIRELISVTPCHIVCLQETELETIDPLTVTHIGGQRLSSFAHWGILLLWDDTAVTPSNIMLGNYYLSADISLIHSSDSFKLTRVYGPTMGRDKDAFFNELCGLKPAPGSKWIVFGDFNQIHRARGKNRRNANRSRMLRFRSALHDCGSPRSIFKIGGLLGAMREIIPP